VAAIDGRLLVVIELPEVVAERPDARRLPALVLAPPDPEARIQFTAAAADDAGPRLD